MYADKITKSMQRTIDETNRRRIIQAEYNALHHITPTTVFKSNDEIFKQTSVIDIRESSYIMPESPLNIAAEDEVSYSKEDLTQKIAELKQKMTKASKKLDFLDAATFRDEMYRLQERLDKVI
jgi:excinuclease ABC subunit B